MTDRVSPKLVKFYRSVSSVLTVAVILIGLVTILGYTIEAYGQSIAYFFSTDLDLIKAIARVFKTILPQSLVSMNPITAIGFIMIGSTSLILNKRTGHEITRRVGMWLAAFIMIGAFYRLTLSLIGYEPYADKFLYPMQVFGESSFTGRAGQIAPNTSLGFALMGTAFFLLFRKKYKPAQYLSVASFFVGFLAALGYAYGVSNLIGLDQYVPMAFNTSVAFGFISLAALFSFPEYGIAALFASDSAGGIIARRLLPLAVVIPAVLGYAAFFSESSGYLSSELGLSVLIVLSVVFFSALIWKEAITIHKVDSKLNEEKTKVSAFLESIGEGLIVTDTSLKISVMNHAAESMLGWSHQEGIGKTLGVDFPIMEDHKGRVIPLGERLFSRALATSQKIVTDITSQETYYYVRKNGTKFPVGIIATPVIMDGEVTGVVSVFRDITAEKELNQKKTEFITLASHQLNTPPSAINWGLETLAGGSLGPLNKEQSGLISELRGISAKMVDIVSSLLSASRLEIGGLVVNPRPVDYVKVIKGAVKELSPKILNKNIELKEVYDPATPIGSSDPAMIKIVVDNLLSNAIKYSSEGGSIKVALDYIRNDNSVRLTVSDGGMGIPKQQQAQVFTKMFRASNAITIDGTGLGLYLVKTIVDTLRGRVWFESEEGKGSTFYVDLPIS